MERSWWDVSCNIKAPRVRGEGETRVAVGEARGGCKGEVRAKGGVRCGVWGMRYGV